MLALIKIYTCPLSYIRVVPSSFSYFSLGYSVNGESIMDRFPVNTFELKDFSFDLDRNMRNINTVLEIEEFYRTFWKLFLYVKVLQS